MNDMTFARAAKTAGPKPSEQTVTKTPTDAATAGAKAHIETEMKFSLEPGMVSRLLKSRLVRRATKGKVVTSNLTSTYFDSRQHLMRKKGGTLRVRKSAEKYEQTIKIPTAGPVGMQNNEEWNIAISGPVPDLDLFDRSVTRRLGRGRRAINIQPVFTTEIRRKTVRLAQGKTRFEMCVDVGEINSHGTKPRTQPICEVEFELVKGSAIAMLDFIIELCNAYEMVPLHLSKAQRGYALARPSLRPKPTKARKVTLDPEMTVGQAFQVIVGDSLRQLQSNHQPVLEGAPGGIHQARVSIRRIRAALRAFKKVLPYDKRMAFNGEFRWFQARLAPARDWHVFLSETIPNIKKSHPDSAPSLAQLRKSTLAERRRATADAREVVSSKRYTRLVLQFQRWLLELDASDQASLHQELMPFARSVLEKTRRDFLLDTRPLSRMSEEDRHNLRKRGKKARYATEFFSRLWDGPGVAPYLKLMEKIQDRLGEANDAVVARQMLACLPPRLLEASTMWVVQEWSEERVQHSIKSGQSLWRNMQRATPFWH